MSFFKKIVLGALLLAGLAAVGPARPAHAEAMDRPANVGNPVGLGGPEQRIALVIGNSNYQNVARLPNPANDAKAVAELLNTAGFEVISATDLNHNQMIEVMQDFSAKIAGRGANTVAMVYYVGHGVQLAGENYLVPVDARISSLGPAGRRDGDAGGDPEPDADCHPRRLPEQSVPLAQRSGTRTCDRRCAERFDRRLFNGARHRSARRRRQSQSLYRCIPAVGA